MSVISGPEEGDNVGLCAMEAFLLRPDLNLGLLYRDSRALDKKEYLMIIFLN